MSGTIRQIRQNCEKIAVKFNFPIEIFKRIPMWFFGYLRSEDPLYIYSNKFNQINMMTIFMLINEIPPELMMAFYNEGHQNVDIVFRLHEIFIKMRQKYDTIPIDDRIEYFGTNFTFHCATRTLRRIDMSQVELGSRTRKNNNFIPNHGSWPFYRDIRHQIRNGTYSVTHELDIAFAFGAMADGLLPRGRKS